MEEVTDRDCEGKRERLQGNRRRGLRAEERVRVPENRPKKKKNEMSSERGDALRLRGKAGTIAKKYQTTLNS